MESVFVVLLILVGAMAILSLVSYIFLVIHMCFTENDSKREAAHKKAGVCLVCTWISLAACIILAFVGTAVEDNKARTCPSCGNVYKMIYSDGDLIMPEHCGECGYRLDQTPTCPACNLKCEAAYCLRCGTPMETFPEETPTTLTCPSCGSHWDSAYCGDCGNLMSANPNPN